MTDETRAERIAKFVEEGKKVDVKEFEEMVRTDILEYGDKVLHKHLEYIRAHSPNPQSPEYVMLVLTMLNGLAKLYTSAAIGTTIAAKPHDPLGGIAVALKTCEKLIANCFEKAIADMPEVLDEALRMMKEEKLNG